MRHSLITALQDFAGAVIVVSHDRGLLRSVCDQFWLVADGAVTDFEGDLEDYSNWLEKRGSAASTPAAPKPRGENDKRDKRRDKGARGDVAPEARKDKSTKRQEIKSIETTLEKLGQERARLEKELAGLDFNRDPAHARKVTERHGVVIREVEQLETRWLELSERLESLNG
jgi:ATP-binding cassette subfamily F protein 3